MKKSFLFLFLIYFSAIYLPAQEVQINSKGFIEINALEIDVSL